MTHAITPSCALRDGPSAPSCATPTRLRRGLGAFATEAQANAGTYAYWVSFAATAQDSANAPSGVISPQGRWHARCPQDGNSALAVADLDDSIENYARPWRRTARDGIYDPHIVHDDPRSEARNAF